MIAGPIWKRPCDNLYLSSIKYIFHRNMWFNPLYTIHRNVYATFNNKRKELIQKGKGGKLHKLIPLTAVEHILNQKNDIDAHNPQARLTCWRKMCLNNINLFGRFGASENHNMKVEVIDHKKNENVIVYYILD